ncbi:uncharacterized protein LOC127417184 [Myxocyprinus asiaticus]|uniref:uncharacterized protein LOC127417184 n=1 Tax=Myxocyprinus asiaticus TaxID=70543 RepID=UPI0022223950|nr:uncharacterized protein LOC127417184 [Myxocyprinus asiaticus]XP_051512966.1 uncharacterized protein LOC127417184 [Myxocyprinus asiaticus]XP_051512967.1 uncharacterized protein LOC127417184 [Myxocyprinus asiaticus]XP_051512968.1 uncharacterized protein LOC127417184 [Myxocyprinus asiaticus]
MNMSWISSIKAFFIFLALVLGIHAMEIQLLTSPLRVLNCHPRLDSETCEHCRELGFLRQPRYIHRSPRNLQSVYCSSPTAIPSIWTKRRCCKTVVASARCSNSCSLRHLTKDDHDSTSIHFGFVRQDLALLNCHSLTDKASILNELITDIKLDMLLLTETWQIPNDFLQLNLLTPHGYKYLSKPRPHGKGGGQAVVCQDGMRAVLTEFHNVTSLEYLALKIVGETPLIVLLIYRPPKYQPHFFSELSEILTLACAMSPHVILLGDFNIHVDTDCSNTTELMNVLECFNLTKYMNFSTHTHGHILDLVCTSGLNNVFTTGTQVDQSTPHHSPPLSVHPYFLTL